MKKFKFRLQSVLDAREKILENCQLEMSKVQNKLNQQIKYLESLYQTLNKTKQDLETLLITGANLDFTLIHNYHGYIVKLKDDIRNQHKIIVDTEIELEEKKQKVIEALKSKTILEKLKEKDFKEFIANFERLDLLEIDEIATNRHNRT